MNEEERARAGANQVRADTLIGIFRAHGLNGISFSAPGYAEASVSIGTMSRIAKILEEIELERRAASL